MSKDFNINSAMNNNKLLNHMDRLAEWKSTGNSSPIAVGLDLTNVCNHRCPQCNGYMGQTDEMISLESLKRIVPQFSEIGVKAVGLGGGGDASCHPDLDKALHLFRDHDIETGLFTNGHVLRDSVKNAIVDCCTWMRVSLDADGPELYEKVHGTKGSNFDKVLDNVKDLVRLKEEKDSSLVIGTSYLLGSHTISGMYGAAKIARDLGVSYIRLRPFFTWDGERPFTRDEADKVLEELRHCQELDTDTFKVSFPGERTTWAMDDELAPNPPGCHMHHFSTIVEADLKVYLCCHMKGIERYSVGDLSKQSFQEIWQSQHRNDVYSNIDFKDCALPCREAANGSLMNEYVAHRDTCRLCQSDQVSKAVDLNPVPIITPNIALPTDTSGTTTAPVDLYLCESCGFLQLLDVVDPDIQYSHYLYRTSTSLGLVKHFEELAKNIVSRYKADPGSLIVEIGSNEGVLLRALRDLDMKVLGIDPAKDLAREATQSGVETLPAFFTEDIAQTIAAERGKANIILANNVVANIDDMKNFINGIKALLSDDGVFVFETQNGADVIRYNLIDTVYHEHLSYFTTRPLRNFFATEGLELVRVEGVATKGGSFNCTVQHAGGPHKVDSSVDRFISQDEMDGIYSLEKYRTYSKTLSALKLAINEFVDDIIAQGGTIAGYGTSVGCMALLHHFGLSSKLDFLIDDKPFKDKIEGPGYILPVLDPQTIYEKKPAAIVILAPRYADVIVGKHPQFKDHGGQFIVPLPELRVL